MSLPEKSSWVVDVAYGSRVLGESHVFGEGAPC